MRYTDVDPDGYGTKALLLGCFFYGWLNILIAHKKDLWQLKFNQKD